MTGEALAYANRYIAGMTIDLLRNMCTALPGVREDVKWGNDLCFSVGGKMFCVTSLDPPFSASFKVTDEEFDELSSAPGFTPAPYMARAKWVLVTEAARLKSGQWQQYIRQSYDLVKAKLPRKQRKDLGLE